MVEAPKKSFLVCDDYGMGGIWAVMRAHSAAEITAKYPSLSIHEERPPWMSDELYRRIENVNSYDVDDQPSGWLAELIRQKRG